MPPCKIGICIYAGLGHLQGLLSGMLHYFDTQDGYQIITPLYNTSLHTIVKYQNELDGVIVGINSEEERKLLSNLPFPVLECTCRIPPGNLPLVSTDNFSIGQMAGSYFIRRRYSSFAYCGYTNLYFSEQRREGFESVIRAHNKKVHIYCTQKIKATDTGTLLFDMIDWLKKLPKPTAVFCVNDVRALELYQATKFLGLKIPEDIALMGVDNDQNLVNPYQIGLTSIGINERKLGHKVAETLLKLIEGKTDPQEAILMPPQQIYSRESTGHPELSNPIVRELIYYIENNLDKDICVADILTSVSYSRRAIERHLSTQLGLSPKELISRMKFEYANELLKNTDLSLKELAHRLGYVEQRKLNRLFEKEIAMTPSSYRSMLESKKTISDINAS